VHDGKELSIQLRGAAGDEAGCELQLMGAGGGGGGGGGGRGLDLAARKRRGC